MRRLLPVVLVLWTSIAHADPSQALVVVSASDKDATSIEVILRELLGRMSIQMQITRAQSIDARDVVVPKPTTDAPLARAWIDAREAERVTVYIVDGPWERVLVRNVPLSNGLGEVEREEVGHVVSDAVEALKSGHRIGFERDVAMRSLGVAADTTEPKEPTPPEQPPPKPKDNPPRLDVEGVYAAQLFAERLFAHGPGMRAALTFGMPRLRTGFVVDFEVRWPISAERAGLAMDLTQVLMRAGGELVLPIARRVDAFFFAGGGADIDTVSSRATTPGATPDTSHTFGVGAFRLELGIHLRPVPFSGLLGLVFDIDPQGTHFYADVGGTQEDVLRPYAVRAGFFLGLGAATSP